jgi:hypothetical protein
LGGLNLRACPGGETVPASMMNERTEALLEEAIIDYLTTGAAMTSWITARVRQALN